MTENHRRHAVVLGSSMGGLLAARVLADFYATVTIVERDLMPETATDRRGVPQGRHVHLLWGRGSRVLESLFPGFTGDLVTAGAPHFSGDLSEIYINSGGHSLLRSGHLPDFELATPSRPLLEWYLRQRVQALSNVTTLPGRDVVQLTCTAARDRVTGVIVRASTGGDEQVIDADLVVDATGRGSRTPVFLAAMGYEHPNELRVEVGLTYSSQALRLPPSMLREMAVIISPVEGRPVGMALFHNENDTWMFTVSAMAGREPPSEFEHMCAFVDGFTPGHVVNALRSGRPLGPGARHRLPSTRWRRYDKARRFPIGLLVLGDAICSLNPVYGQGMTVAALEASALRQCLVDGSDDLARRYFGKTAEIVGNAWQLATGSDLSLPEVDGPRPLSLRLVNKYVAQAQAAAERDIVVAERLSNVAGLVDPPSRLLHPAVVARVIKIRLST